MTTPMIEMPATSSLPRPLTHRAPLDAPSEHAHSGDAAERSIERDQSHDATRSLTTAAVLFVAGIAAIVSFLHIRELALTYGQGHLAAVLTPLSIDGTVVVASLAMLRAARAGIDTPFLARFMLVLAVAATLAANIGYGVPHGVPGALISGWPAVAFIGSVEIAVGMVRRLSSVHSEQSHDASSEHPADQSLTGPVDQQPAISEPPLASAQPLPLAERRGGESDHAPAPALTPAPKRRRAQPRRKSGSSRNQYPIIRDAIDRAGGYDAISAEEIHAQTRIPLSTIRRHRATYRRENGEHPLEEVTGDAR